MRRHLGLAMAAAFCLALTPAAKAQIWVSTGNPYGMYGSGYYPTGYTTTIGPGYAAGTGWGTAWSPGATYYSSGYAGFAPRAYSATTFYPTAYSYSYPVGYGYSYGYPAYGYGMRRGPLGGWRVGRTYGGFW